MKKAVLLFSLFFGFIFSGNIFADTLFLKNGTKFTGRTIKQDAEKVIFRIGTDQDGMDITFFSDEVLRIDKAEVSSFITLPMGQGKQINIPRPTFSKEPILTEQARTQSEKLKKSKETENPEAELKEGQETNTTLQEDKQLDDLSKVTESDLFSQQKNIIGELTPLLNKEEGDYFSKINSMVKEPMSNAMRILTDPTALSKDSDKLSQLIKDTPSQMGDIIKQLNSLEPPSVFVDFHKKYLDDIALISDAFSDMSKGEVADSQEKIQKMQAMNNELQRELARILDEKKNKK